MDFKYQLKNLSVEQISQFYGSEDYNLKLIEKEFACDIFANGEKILIKPKQDNKDLIIKCLDSIISLIKEKKEINNQDVIQIINFVLQKQEKFDNNVKFVSTHNGKIIRPKNKAQENYYHLLENNTIVFAMGCAGTGKTYLAVAYGVSLLKQKKIEKIIVTRPIVEAGENLGFLPGELKEKVDPYLTPIYDAFYDILGKETTDKYIDRAIIEIAPLAYMRGRTLSNAFVILDEAQNTTPTQMKMFLTRLGYDSKMVITGDESQIDLKESIKSGILVATEILNNINDIAIIKFSSKDVIRHPLVGKIINAYEKYQQELKK